MRPEQARAGALAAGLTALLALAGGAGCAHQAAKGAAEGFAQRTQEMQAGAPAEQQISRIASSRAVEGAIDTLAQPEQREKIQRLIDAAVAEAVASAFRAALAPASVSGLAAGPGGGEPAGRGAVATLAGQIGRAATEDALGSVAAQLGGDGALSQSLVATGARATDAAVGAALGELFPECHGDEAAAAECRRARMQALTRATAASVSAGVRDSLAWPLLFLAAAVGLTLGALAHWAVTLRRRRPHALRPV